MYALLIVFEWSPTCEDDFEKLKKELIISAPILRAPDWAKCSMSTLMPLDVFCQLGENHMNFWKVGMGSKDYTTVMPIEIFLSLSHRRKLNPTGAWKLIPYGRLHKHNDVLLKTQPLQLTQLMQLQAPITQEGNAL